MDKDLQIEALEQLVYKLKKDISSLEATNECLFNESTTLTKIGSSIDADKFALLVKSSTDIDEKQKFDIIDYANDL